MSTRSILIFCIISFVLGLVGGFCISHFLLPNLWKVEQEIKDQSVYQVEHNVCPEEENLGPQCNIFVDISGAVKAPGVYCFYDGDRVVDAVKKAGGFIQTSSLQYIYRSINLSKKLSDSQKIYIPSTKELLCELKPFTLKEEEIAPPDEEEGNTTGLNTNENTETEIECVNINTASITELDSLDGIGPSTAQKIIDNRPYSSTSDILDVSGIGDATYQKFKDNICI